MDTLTPAQRSERMSRVKGKGSAAERSFPVPIHGTEALDDPKGVHAKARREVSVVLGDYAPLHMRASRLRAFAWIRLAFRGDLLGEEIIPQVSDFQVSRVYKNDLRRSPSGREIARSG